MSFMTSLSGGRGGYAPRRGRGGSSRPFVKRQDPVKPDLTKYPLGELLVSLRTSNLEPSNTHLSLPQIEDCQYVASYNWLAEHSTILVPGQPPQWTPLKIARRLPEDSGTYYRDPNAAHYPEYPIAPAVKAIMDTTDDTIVGADFFACGSTLGNLLRFVRGIDKAFRFSVETIGDIVFLIRKENDPKELIEGVRGFGHTFPEAYTTWPKGVQGSETHQRIVQYNLGGLQCLVRFECDGFFDNSTKPSSSEASRGKDPAALPSEDVLAQTLAGTAVSNPQTTSTGPLTIRHRGSIVSQNSIFDLKTRSGKYKKEINMDDITPQLWLKQIPNFIVAYHDGAGMFEDIQIQDVRSLVSTWEKDNARSIRLLIALLKKIIDVAKADQGGLLEVYCSGTGELEIRKQVGDGVHALPTALSEEWARRCESDGGFQFTEDTGYGASPDFPNDSFDDSYDDSDDDGKDFTACSADDCGYCGRCTY
ncbi:uncharacterized protein EKO05_0011279 [Ascochyta rabiei]|uniref:Uncharacterized protein n=1 Tax=Didymella rabiei TaxID=5454 RepID=A0A163E651_DIDRA|nr:uncharacterized protein EKO05_0011279 [Ascochyta rabiei]KZM23539.1 hypothetical protein ST47_g5287 [Ascochyta rabiei]UPX21075.1 hypothetical protein EKO05_0011279 [Ascochyta rabiei]